MATVTHNTFGTGTVISMNEKNVTVDFNGEVKTLIIAFARLKNEDGSAFGITFIAKPKKVKKLNKANFMTQEEFEKTGYANRSNDDYLEDRQRAAWASKSF